MSFDLWIADQIAIKVRSLKNYLVILQLHIHDIKSTTLSL